MRHARKHNGKYLIGATFENLKDDVRHRITEWVHQVETEITQEASQPVPDSAQVAAEVFTVN